MAAYYFALTDINNAIDRLIHACPTTFYNGLQAARNIFSKDLAADVVPVVRCKDCRHRDPEDHKCDSGEMERQGCPFPVHDDYFCAYGER